MIILLHVSIALASLALTTFSAFRPSRRKIYTSYALVALTLASGTYLVISLHSPMLKACGTGLVYLAIALTGLFVAQHRLSLVRE